MSTFMFRVTTPIGKVFKDEVDAVTLPGVRGQLGILANHAPVITQLKEGPLVIKQGGKELYFAIDSGIVEADQEHACLILADQAVKADSLEEAKVKAKELLEAKSV